MSLIKLEIKKKPVSSKIGIPVLNAYISFDINKYNLPLGRSRFNKVGSLGIKPKIDKITNYKIGNVPVREYVYNTSSSYLVYFHGGGYVLGSLDSHDIVCRRLAKYCKLNIVSVDYSLAPESKFPKQLDEGRTVIGDIIKKRGPAIYLGGDSAGGNLAAVLSAEYENLLGQILFYPLTNGSLENPSIDKIGVLRNFLTGHMLRWFRDQYVPKGIAYDNPQLSPYKLKNRTPAFIAVGDRDPLIDDCKQYADAMDKQNTPCTLVILPHTIHGFMQQPRRFGYKLVLDQLNEFIASL